MSKKFEYRKRGESATNIYANINKQKMKIAKLHMRPYNIRTDYINKTISEIVKREPSFITLEDLNIKGWMKNRHIAKSVANMKLSEFKTRLIAKAKSKNIEVREVSRWFPSSGLCSNCNSHYNDQNQESKWSINIKQWTCKMCNTTHDRDINAALNLQKATEYIVLI